MRQNLTPADEPHLLLRALAINYSAGGYEDRHAHDWPQLLYASSGAIRVECEAKWWIIPPRRGLWIPAGRRHCLRMSSRLELRTLYISPGFAGARERTEAFNVSGLLHEAILRVCEIGFLDGRSATDRNLGAIILSELDRAESSAFTLALPHDPRGRRLAALLESNDEGQVAIDALCAQVGLSRRTAERLFLKETGLSPAQWRRFAVLSESFVAIAGGQRIEDAAFASGYQSRSGFSDAFTRAFGRSPGQFSPG